MLACFNNGNAIKVILAPVDEMLGDDLVAGRNADLLEHVLRHEVAPMRI